MSKRGGGKPAPFFPPALLLSVFPVISTPVLFLTQVSVYSFLSPALKEAGSPAWVCLCACMSNSMHRKPLHSCPPRFYPELC